VGWARTDQPPALAPVLIVIGLSLWGGALALVMTSAGALYWIPMLAATLVPFVLYASRNPRLFCLIGMTGTAVLGLSINFSRRIHVGGAPSYSLDAMDLFMLPLLVFIARDYFAGYRKDLRFSSISYWWFGLIALGLLNVVSGAFREFAMFEVVRMLKCWLLFFVIINECVRQKHFHHVVMALACGMTVNLIVALIQFSLKRVLGLEALGEPAPEAVLGANYGVYLGGGGVYRVSGLVAHPNLFGAYLASLIPLYLALLFTDYRRAVKVLLGGICGCAVVVLMLTLSRTSWADFAVAMFVLAVVLLAHPVLRRRHLRLKIVLGTIGVIGGLVAAGPIITRLTTSDPGALDFRYEWLGIAWKMVQARPLLGFGLNSFSNQIADYSPYSIGKLIELFGPVWPVVHNTYFLVWAEQGTIGLVLFVGLHIHVLVLGLKNMRYMLSSKVALVSIGAACSVIAIIVDGFGSFYERVPATDRMFWISIGLIVAARYWNLANDPRRASARVSTAQSGPLMGYGRPPLPFGSNAA